MSKWETKQLGDISEMCLGKMLDESKNKGEYQPYLANINVRWGAFDFKNLNKMRFENSERDRYGVQYGDLVVCEGGEPGRCAIWKDEVPWMKIQKALHRVRINGNYSNEFVYYRFLLAGRNGELKKHFIGSTIKHLTGVGLKQVEFAFPLLTEQKKIAAVLSALDAKIELNNRINAESEAMAKTLYDYWFVQFDFPDKNGKPYKSSGGKMVWNEKLKREIPEGWAVNELGTVLSTSLGGTPSTLNKVFWENGSFNWLNSGEIAEFPIVSSELKITEEAIKKSAAELLPKGTTLLSITRHLRPTILAIEACANQSVVGIREKGDIKSCYIYPYLKNEIPRYLVLRTGAQQPHINKETVDDSLIVLPNEHSDILNSYNLKAAPIYNQIINNAFQNQHLSSLRDWLLPMLMNGQVKVS